MEKYEISVIGTFHTNHNEDFLTINELGNDHSLIAVMDGCSMGKESYFISTLIGKILRKLSKEISFRNFIEKNKISLKGYIREITEKLFFELKNLKYSLMLDRSEVLSTLILGVVDHTNKEAEILTVGDGLICHNGQYIEYEQDDKPDYLGYHLAGEFLVWFDAQAQILSLKEVKDLSISTDGIFTFKYFDTKDYPVIEETELVDFLLINKEGLGQKNMLKKKLLQIEDHYGLKPSDDLSIIRIVID